MTSPLTIVAPREGNDLKRASALGLADGFRFSDPTPNLGTQAAADVGAWVSNMGANISLMGHGTPQIWHTAVTSALKGFHDALAAKGAEHPVPQLSFDPHDLGIAGAYGKLIGKALSVGTLHSDVELRRPDGSTAPRLLVIDEATPEQWGLPPSSVRIWGAVTHANISGLPAGSGPNRIGPTTLTGISWVSPDNLLLDKLTVVNKANAFRDVTGTPGTDQLAVERSITPVLPITETLLQYLHPDYIALNSRFVTVGNGIQFSLQLPVGDDGRTILARKTYPFDQLIRVDPIHLPICEVWPGEALPDWKAWYAFCSNAGIRARYVIRPIGSTSGLREERLPDGSPDVLLTMSFEKPAFFGFRELQPTHGGNPTEAYRGLVIPEYKNPAISGIQGNAQIGFDFGTTSTEIYIKVGAKEPEPLSLKISTAAITAGEEESRLGAMYRFFIPPGDPEEKGPFLSLLRRRRGSVETLQPESVTEAHVLFYRSKNSKDQLDDPHVHGYLKWDSVLHGDRAAFLYQFALMATLEAVRSGATSIQFHYSYPTAFNPVQKQWIIQAWPEILTRLRSALPANCELPPAIAKTESVAAAQYFSRIDYDDRALTDVGSLVIDVGGGTSDISVWKGGEVRFQTSLRWSAREILLQALERERAELDGLLFDQLAGPAEFRKPFSEKTGESFYRYADALLRSHGEYFLGKLVHATGKPEYLRLCSYISLAFGGLLYYAGRLLRAADSEKVPRIYVAGNGSRILHWLSPRLYTADSPFHKLFQDAIHTGADVDGVSGGNRPGPAVYPTRSPLRMIVSREPKCEAAKGLVTAMAHELGSPEDRQGIIAGEKFSIDGIVHDSLSELTGDQLSRNNVDIISLEELKTWLEVYNGFASTPGQVAVPISNLEDVLTRAIDDVRQDCADCHGRDPNSINVSPLFILGLEAAIKKIELGGVRRATV